MVKQVCWKLERQKCGRNKRIKEGVSRSRVAISQDVRRAVKKIWLRDWQRAETILNGFLPAVV